MKILLVQTSYLGDVILSTPVIAGINTLYPEAELWMMTTPLAAGLVDRDPLLAGVIPLDKRRNAAGVKGVLDTARHLRAMAFDLVYSLHRSYRTALILALAQIPMRIGFADSRLSFLYQQRHRRNPAEHDVLRNLAILGEQADGTCLSAELRLFPPAIEEMSDTVRQVFSLSPYAVLVPGSVWATKRWHPEGFRRTAAYLLDRGYQVLLLGTEEDLSVNRRVSPGLPVIDFAGKTSIAEALHIIRGASLVVCNDSMALHAASAFKVPTVAVFCATSPNFGFGPWRNNAIVVGKELACRPCSRHGGHRCRKGTEACMTEVDFDLIVDAIQAVKRAR